MNKGVNIMANKIDGINDHLVSLSAWFDSLPNWIKQACNFLCDNESLTKKHLNELVQLCKKETSDKGKKSVLNYPII